MHLKLNSIEVAVTLRVGNPGLPEPENPGNPDLFQTRNPGFNGTSNPGFRVYFLPFFMCNFIIIHVSLGINSLRKTAI